MSKPIIKKKIFNLSSAEFAHSLLSIKVKGNKMKKTDITLLLEHINFYIKLNVALHHKMILTT